MGSFDGDFNYFSDVGAQWASMSAFGTFDDGGNVWEWNEDIVVSGT